MEKKAALKVLDSLVEQHGKMVAADMLAKSAKVPQATAYGWLRRGRIPEWRLPAIAALAKKGA